MLDCRFSKISPVPHLDKVRTRNSIRSSNSIDSFRKLCAHFSEPTSYSTSDSVLYRLLRKTVITKVLGVFKMVVSGLRSPVVFDIQIWFFKSFVQS